MPRRVSQTSFDGAAGAVERKGGRGKSHSFGEADLSRPVSEGHMREGVHVGRAKVYGGPNKTRHLSRNFITTSADYERIPNPAKPLAPCAQTGSVCPWQPQDHPDHGESKTRAHVSLPDRREPRRSKSPGLAPTWPGHQAADFPVPNRFPLDKNGVPNATLSGPRRRFFYDGQDMAKRSTETTDARTAGRKYFEPTVSDNAEFVKGGRSVAGNSFPTTSIMGREQATSAVRTRTPSPDRFRFEAPYSEHTRNHGGSSFHRSASADSVNRGVRMVGSRLSNGPSAPFDEHRQRPAAAEAGEAKPAPGVVRHYRPATRIFSQQPGQGNSSTHQRIWG